MNTYFQFKQFIINQDKCAQKVSEIACIQGAWTSIPHNAIRVLDIGSGTGLLSLMMAQRYPSIDLDAIEIDLSTFEQLNENINNSNFKNRIQCIHEDIRNYNPTSLYDFIIVNPPFFENQLTSPHQHKNQAWHSSSLSLDDLLKSLNRLLSPEGAFSILLPYSRTSSFEALALQFDFLAYHSLLIRHSETHPLKFMVGLYSKNKSEQSTKQLSVKQNQAYSQEMKSLMKPFYLKL